MAPSVHGTVVVIGGAGALLVGASGSGKSDLALRLIDRGAVLLADDRVDLTVEAGQLLARAPAGLPPLLEVRGIGLLPAQPVAGPIPVAAVFELGRASERLPVPELWRYESIAVPLFRIDPTTASAAARVRAVMASRPVAA